MESRLLRRGESSGRSDDKAEVIKKRFHTFVKETVPVVEFFGAKDQVSWIACVRACVLFVDGYWLVACIFTCQQAGCIKLRMS